MNEWTELEVYTQPDTLFNVGSVYGGTHILPSEWSSSILAKFPWLALLQEEGTLPVEDDIKCFGLKSTVNGVNMIRTADDPLEFYMKRDSRQVVASNMSSYTDWVKLPDSASWIYGTRPFIPIEYLNEVLSELRDALASNEASEELLQFIWTHTAKYPHNRQKYMSYNEYYKFTQHRSLSGSNILYEFGKYISEEKEPVDITVSGDIIHINDPQYKTIELLIQKRIGNQLSTQRILLVVEYDYIHTIYLTTDEVGYLNVLSIDDERVVNVSITRCYDDTNRIPVLLNPDHASTTRTVDNRVLTTNTGWVSMPSMFLKVNGINIYTAIPTDPITASSLTFDSLVFSMGPIENSKLYVEYTASWA